MSTATPVAPASVSMIRAMIDQARSPRFRFPSGVIGLLAQPDRAAHQDIEHDGQLVRIRPASSALAVREALTEHRDGDWMVVLTDQSEADLGAGVLAHLVWNRLRRPDPWEAVRHRFKASGIDPSLTAGPDNRALALALLAATPESGWPAAPAGILTRSHALASVARSRLDLAGEVTDLITVLDWSVRPSAVTALADLRADLGDVLTDATIDWLAEAAGAAAVPIRALLARGEVSDLVALGLVAHLLVDDSALDAQERHTAAMALVRLESHWGTGVPSAAALSAFGAAATAVVTDLAGVERQGAHVNRVLQRADALLDHVQAGSLAVHSDVSPRGLRARLMLLAETLARGVAGRQPGTPPGADARSAVEAAWSLTQRHRLARDSSADVRAFAAAVRLWRWLATPPVAEGEPLAARVRRHIDHDGWADAALHDAYAGVDDEALSRGLRLVVQAAAARRERDERAFAASLALATEQDLGASEGGLVGPDGTVWFVESVLPKVILPMARKAPVLLIVLDGMSAAASSEIVADATGRLQWVEAGLTAGMNRRAAALSVLPSLTEYSRASLLCGRLVRGQQDVESRGYEALTAQSAKITAKLFHKKAIDTTGPGSSVAGGVGAAIDDRDGIRLVTVVLNTIDDALDRSDPAGTMWTADAVKHLEPLLARARAAQRTVVLTADHGHVVERRQGTQRSYPGATSGRSRAVAGVVDSDEVQVRGRRVLTDDGTAILGVSEGLRYGPLKAGYHGGASAAEVVVPVVMLLPDEDTNQLRLPLLAPQAPAWWSVAEVPLADTGESGPIGLPTRIPQRVTRGRAKPVDAGPTLFDSLSAPAGRPTSSGLGRHVIESAAYAAQRSVAGRVSVTDAQIEALLDALVAAAGTRLPEPLVAAALGVNEVRVRGAVAQVQQLLNVEGYAVVATDADGRTVVLDERLLRQQFEVAG